MKYKYIAFGHVYNVILEKKAYANGRTALLLISADGEIPGEQVACATVNLPEYDIQANEIIVKTWSENEGMLEFLIRNRIASDTGRELSTGFVKARVCKLLI